MMLSLVVSASVISSFYGVKGARSVSSSYECPRTMTLGLP